jgi:hypothetical protein
MMVARQFIAWNRFKSRPAPEGAVWLDRRCSLILDSE